MVISNVDTSHLLDQISLFGVINGTGDFSFLRFPDLNLD